MKIAMQVFPMRCRSARDEERARRQQDQFDEGMAFRKQQADALENYRAKQFEIQQDTQQKLAVNQQKRMISTSLRSW
ncbi:hypothetical protein AB9E28_31035 [Rhizobium leguminosarum]|uniref:hypothetical protein n=1 Tax=Rhizobium leguminosarum TaxID=384 RepID=UPI003F9E443A